MTFGCMESRVFISARKLGPGEAKAGLPWTVNQRGSVLRFARADEWFCHFRCWVMGCHRFWTWTIIPHDPDFFAILYTKPWNISKLTWMSTDILILVWIIIYFLIKLHFSWKNENFGSPLRREASCEYWWIPQCAHPAVPMNMASKMW